MNFEDLAREWVRMRAEGCGAVHALDLVKRVLEKATAEAFVLLVDEYARISFLRRTGRYPPELFRLIYATLAGLNDAAAPENNASTIAPEWIDAVGEIVWRLGGASTETVYRQAGVLPQNPYQVVPSSPPKPSFHKLELIIEEIRPDGVTGADKHGNVVRVNFAHRDGLAGKPVEYWFRIGNKVLFHRLSAAVGEGTNMVTNEETLWILEPDYLVNVTDMAEAAAQSETADWLRRYFNLEPPRRSTVTGSMINAMLDEWIRRPEATADEVVGAVQRAYAFLLAYMHLSGGTGGDFDRTVEDVSGELYKQAPVLQALARRLHAKKYNVWIEPSFIAPQYGLQGRMDLLLTQDNRPEFKTIIELKAGRPPKPEFEVVRAEHHYQLAGYDMLLGDARRVGHSCVFYSQETDLERATRTVSTDTKVKRTVVAARNRLVREDFMLCENDFSFLENMARTLPTDVPSFKQMDAVVFCETLAHLNVVERAYFFAFSGFVAREHRQAKIGTPRGGESYADLWLKTEEQKSLDFSALIELEVDFEGSDPEAGYYRFWRRSKAARMPVSFRPDDPVVLYDMERGPVGTQILKATLVSMDDAAVVTALRNKQFEAHYLTGGRHWVMGPDFMEKSDRALYQSLFRWVYDGDERKRRVFLGLIPPRFVPVAAAPPAYLDRPEQIEMFRKALAAQDYFLLQGPPGTGKTSRLLRALVDHLYRQTTQTLALLAYTNRAADEICEQLLELRLPFYRLGFCRMENVPTEKSLSRTLTPAQIHDFLLDIRIVVSTVASFVAKLNDWSFKKFDTAIIDEASQLLEPHVCGIWTRFSRLILIGDEKQLPAVVAQPEPGRQPPPALARALQTTGIDDLGRAVFDRMLERCKQNAWHEAYGMLTAQGRMHQDIARFVGERYYGGRLEVVSPRQTRPFDLHPAGSFLSRARVMFVNVPADKNAKLNVAEARLAAQMAAAFPGETGVISPFRAQIAEIVRRLPPHVRSRITVDTVERYQGSQRDFIVYSVCANYPEQLNVLSSLSDDGTVDRKLNVALTRAREQIVVLGNAEILSRSPHYAALIEYARSLGGYAEAAEWTDA